MTAPKPGDRVRVTYTGTVDSDGWAVMDRKLWRFPGAITAEAMAANPRFPSCDLWLELRTVYVREAHRELDLDAIARLWIRALGLWRRHACPDCDGHGRIYDHSSPDPQQHWDRTCWTCRETGVIDTERRAA